MQRYAGNFKKIQEKYCMPHENSELFHNLVKACKIANLTRNLIKKSPSHPDTNDMSQHQHIRWSL
jgi:hypothetical protein